MIFIMDNLPNSYEAIIRYLLCLATRVDNEEAKVYFLWILQSHYRQNEQEI